MNPVEVKTALMTVFLKIQTKCGLECPPLDGTSVPPKVLPKFDSTVWPAATTLLAQALKIIIPNDVHIFGGKHGGPLLDSGRDDFIGLSELPQASRVGNHCRGVNL